METTTGKGVMNRMKNASKKLATVRNKIGAKAMNLTYRLKNAYNSTIHKGGKKTRKASGRKIKRTRKMRGGVPPLPTIPKPVELQRMNKLREAVPELKKLSVVKLLIEKLWPGFTCTTPMVTVQIAGVQTANGHIESMKEDLHKAIMNESTASSTVKNLGKSALAFIKSKTPALGNLGKAQVASKLDTMNFLDSILASTTVDVPCEQAKLLALRLITFYDLNPLEYSGMNKGSKHAAANTRKEAREDLRNLATYYRTNTNILNSFIKKYATDEGKREKLKNALLVSMRSNATGNKVASVQQMLVQQMLDQQIRKKAVESAQSKGLSTSRKVYNAASMFTGL
jgi:hypothetical protein